jgi:membrane protease YdiL (CAAX protease family)
VAVRTGERRPPNRPRDLAEYRARRAPPSAVPPAPLPPRALAEELLIVLSLSVLASAVFAVISLASAPLEGVTVASADQSPLFAQQLARFVFGLAPVWLVAYLVARDGEGASASGLAWDRPRQDVVRGTVLFVVVAMGGIAVYLGAVALGVNRFAVPVAFLTAAAAALLEETIVVGYLITRLRQLRWTPVAAVGASALLRAMYHLYQGWGGFLGNLAMGALFAVAFVRTRRTWPLVFAHFLLDVGAAIGYLAFGDRLPGFR